MEVVSAIILLRLAIATLTIAQLTAMRVNGVIGVRALTHAVAALNTELALISHHNMEVVSAIIALKLAIATLTIAQLTAM